MKAHLRNITMFAGALLMTTVLYAASGCDAAPPAKGNTQVVDGVEIYLGVMPAETIREHPKGHPEASMHDGTPTHGGSDHIDLSLFDNATGRRIENAQVSANVTELGGGSEHKKLEPMRIADSISYGNYFDMHAKEEYLIELSIFIPDTNQQTEARFQHKSFGR